MIQPHGGKLVDRVIKQAREEALKKAERLFQLVVDEEKAKEVQNIAHGIFSPLEGFQSKSDSLSVLENGRLENGLPWTIPIILDISPSADIGDKSDEGQDVSLRVEMGNPG